MTREIVFVCIFNVKRSVIAEHFLRRRLDLDPPSASNRIVVSSAGFLGKSVLEWFVQNSIPLPEPLFGCSPSQLIQEILLERGIDLSLHRSRPIDACLLERAYTVVPLLEILKEDLIREFPHFEMKVISPRE